MGECPGSIGLTGGGSRVNTRVFTVEEGRGPLDATAIHDGHAVRPEVERLMALDEASRLREEDPFTGRWTAVAATRIVGT